MIFFQFAKYSYDEGQNALRYGRVVVAISFPIAYKEFYHTSNDVST